MGWTNSNIDLLGLYLLTLVIISSIVIGEFGTAPNNSDTVNGTQCFWMVYGYRGHQEKGFKFNVTDDNLKLKIFLF